MAGWSGLAKLDLTPLLGVFSVGVQRRAKAVAAAIGSVGVTATTVTALVHAPAWVTVVIAVATGLAAPIATYQTPNAPKHSAED